EKDVFLSIFNPLYFIEELGDTGKSLLEMYLPRVSQAEVLAQLSEPVRRHLEKEEILSPEAYLKARREKIRSLEEQITYTTGQRDQAAAQKKCNAERNGSLSQQYKALKQELAGLKKKQFSGVDVDALNEKLLDHSARYSEARRDGQTDDTELREQLTALREKIAARKAEQYQSKYAQPLADAKARVQALAAQYNQDAAAYQALVPGAPCPICRRSVTEEELPRIQEELRNSANAVRIQGQEQQAQIAELQQLDQKARETFERYRTDDLAKWEAETRQLESKIQQLADDAAAQVESLRMEIQQLTADLEYGKLTQEEYDRLQACQEECRQCEAEMTALQSVEDADAAGFDQKIDDLKAEVAEQKKLISDVTVYASKRAEMTFSALRMNRVEISLFDVVKSTGEWKDAFKFTYNGRRYDRLSLSEKVRAGMEVSELVKRLTGRNYPVFVDNMESIDDLENVWPTGQLFLAKCVSKAALSVVPVRPIPAAVSKAA
ncbi:MAG: hypothetical protein K2P20_08600, partial [Oscillospiraceae bacterium]|nr:hypothetical protein [Oscillospiraceae bacterium]